MTETFICDHCGGIRYTRNEEFFNGAHLCHDCFMSETTICNHCRQRIWNQDNAVAEDNPICQGCVDSHRHDGIQSYYYRPDPIFFGEGKRFLGVELEIDEGGEQDSTIARILFFVENHWNELLRFSRRTQRQLNKWAARYGRKDSPKEVLDSAKSASAGRYTCVNLTNHDTFEFRIFRGTLKYNTIIATLQLVDELCNVAIYLSDEEMQGLTWTDFVSHLDGEKYPQLIQYLKERRLYVNEMIESEEDI